MGKGSRNNEAIPNCAFFSSAPFVLHRNRTVVSIKIGRGEAQEGEDPSFSAMEGRSSVTRLGLKDERQRITMANAYGTRCGLEK